MAKAAAPIEWQLDDVPTDDLVREVLARSASALVIRVPPSNGHEWSADLWQAGGREDLAALVGWCEARRVLHHVVRRAQP